MTLAVTFLFGCGWGTDDSAAQFDRLDGAQAELLAIGRAAYGSEAVEVAQIANCIDEPASVWARWEVDDEDPTDIEDRAAVAAEERGWDVDLTQPFSTATKTLDGVSYGLSVRPSTSSERADADVVLRAQWLDEEPC